MKTTQSHFDFNLGFEMAKRQVCVWLIKTSKWPSSFPTHTVYKSAQMPLKSIIIENVNNVDRGTNALLSSSEGHNYNAVF